MSQKEKKTCQACHAFLFEDDDVVYCPVCGAPHHRECYNAVGHCALEKFHGTDKQYSQVFDDSEQDNKEKTNEKSDVNITVKCPSCGDEYSVNNVACPKCGTPNAARFAGNFGYFDFLGGVPAETDLGEGVTASQACRLVGSNTHRYIPKFAAMAAGIKRSWNWAAFIFPSGWLLARKMYKGGILTAAMSIAFAMLQIPLIGAISRFATDASNYQAIASVMSENFQSLGIANIISFILGGVLQFILMIAVAIKGDMLYRNYTIRSVVKIKTESSDEDADYRRLGGVNIFAMFLGFIAVRYLPTIISLFAES